MLVSITIIELLLLHAFVLVHRRSLTIHAFHWHTHLVLKRSQISGRSAHLHLFVLVLSLLKVLLPLLLGELKHFELLLLLTLLSCISSVTWNTTLKQSNLLRELYLLFSHLIDALDQGHVVLHESCVAFSMLLKAASELTTVVLDVGLINFAFTILLSTLVGSLRSLACLLFLDPSLVETHDASLQLLVVSDVLDNLEYIVLETFLSKDLNVKGMSASQVFFLKTLVAHLKILNDEFQVCADGLEVLHFDLHLIDLFVQRGDIVFTWKDITL